MVWIHLANPQTGARAEDFSWQDMEDLRGGAKSLERVATYGTDSGRWASEGGGEERRKK